MKRIEFVFPVDAMRGNLSGDQKLVYAENDNPAFDAPVGSVHYARNYQPRFIGSKRSKDGLKYFSVKTKSAVNLTPATKLHLAIFGGAAAIYNAMKKNTEVWMTLVLAYTAFTQNGGTMSIRQYAIRALSRGLEVKQADLILSFGNKECVVANPFFGDRSSQSGAWVDITTESLIKFWGELCPAPRLFTIGGAKGIAKEGMTFSSIINDNQYLNILGLSSEEIEPEAPYEAYTAVKFGEVYVTRTLAGVESAVKVGDTIAPVDYTTSLEPIMVEA